MKSKLHKKKISIIIPTKNGGKYIWAAVESVLSQVYNDMELIVSVNHSNDKTLEILKKIKKDSRLRILVPPKPLTLVEHFEWCVSQSKGEWITVIGDDDGLMPFFFKEFEDLIKKWKKKVDVFTFRRAYYFWPGCDKLSNKYEINIKSQKREKQISGKILLCRVLFLDLSFVDLPQIYTNNIIKKNFIQKIKKKSNNKLFHEPCADIYSGVVNCLLAKKIIRSENSIFWTGTSPKSTGLKTFKNTSKVMLDFKKNFIYSKIKISKEIGIEPWTFLPSGTLFTLSSIYNLPFFFSRVLKYKRLLMFLSSPKIYNDIKIGFDDNNVIYKKKLRIFKEMLARNNLIDFFILIKFISKITKIVTFLSQVLNKLYDILFKFQYKIQVVKTKKPKIQNLISANKFLLKI